MRTDWRDAAVGQLRLVPIEHRLELAQLTPDERRAEYQRQQTRMYWLQPHSRTHVGDKACFDFCLRVQQTLSVITMEESRAAMRMQFLSASSSP